MVAAEDDATAAAALEEVDMDPRVARAAEFLTREVAAMAAANPPADGTTPPPPLSHVLLSAGEAWRGDGRESDALVAFSAAFIQAERDEGQADLAERRTVAVAAGCVGASLLAMDAPEAAVGYLRLAHTLHIARSGAYGGDALGVAGDLVAALVRVDRADDAVSLLEGLAARATRRADTDAVVDLHTNMACTAQVHGNLGAAIAGHQRVATHWLPRADAGSADAAHKAAGALSNLGIALADVGSMAEAESVARRAVALFEAADGLRAESTGTALMRLGALQLAANARHEARPTLTRAHDILTAAGNDAAPNVAALLARCDEAPPDPN